MTKLTNRIRKPRTHKEMRSASDQSIIDAAIELFAEKGYQRTTLNQIGARAGFTGTLISNRYGSKDGLLTVVLRHILDRFQDELGDVVSQIAEPASDAYSIKNLLQRYVALYLEDVETHQSRIRALYVILGESLAGMPEIQKQVQNVNKVFRGPIEGMLTLGVERGEFRKDLDVQSAAIMIVGLLRGTAAQLLTEPETLSSARIIPHVQRAIIDTLT